MAVVAPGQLKLSSKDREDDMSHTRDPSSTNERRRQQVAATWQKCKLQMNIQQQAAGQLPTVQGEQSGCQRQAQGQAEGPASQQEATQRSHQSEQQQRCKHVRASGHLPKSTCSAWQLRS